MNDRYIQISCTLDSSDFENDSNIVVAVMYNYGGEGFYFEGQTVHVYIPYSVYTPEIQGVLSELTLLSGYVSDIRVKTIDQKNWNEAWEQSFEPVEINDACIIKAPFHQVKTNHQYEIIIEPKMSFGTGHHETTWLMLDTITNLELSGSEVLDVGSGTGVLSVLASKKGANHIVAIDNEEWAYWNALENIDRNRCDNILVYQGTVDLVQNLCYDVIFANINIQVLLSEIPKYSNLLNPGGLILFSGYLKGNEQSLKEKAEHVNLQYESSRTKHEWVASIYQKTTV